MKAAITTLLLLGTSTAALADSPTYAPSYHQPNRQPYDDRYDDRDDDRYDDRYDDNDNNRYDGRGDRFARRMWFRRPVVLAQNVSFVQQWNQHERRPLLVHLDGRTRNFTKLRLERTAGRMAIDAVVINYADGHQQTLRVGQMLGARQPSIHLDIERGGATSMYVYGSAMRGRGSFDVIGLRR